MKICCVFNHNPFYRYPIYSRLSESFDCDFYFGTSGTAKPFCPENLKGFKHKINSRKIFKNFVWDSNIKDIFSSKYSCYLLTGSPDYLINWLILIYAKMSGKKVYYWTHGIREHVKGLKSLIISKLFYLPADGVFLYGKKSIPFLKEIGCKAEKLIVIHNSLDTEKLDKIYNGLKDSSIYNKHFNNSNPTIIYIGRLQKRKKINQLIEAVALLKQRGKEVNLVIVGKELDDYSLKDLSKSLKVESNVWFYGESYNEENNAELLYNSYLCVCPAAVGLTCIHSLSYGTPVLSNDDFKNQMPEHEAIVPNFTGSFFAKDNVVDLSNQIERWCFISKTERDEIRKNSRESVLKEWSVNYQIKEFKKVFSK